MTRQGIADRIKKIMEEELFPYADEHSMNRVVKRVMAEWDQGFVYEIPKEWYKRIQTWI